MKRRGAFSMEREPRGVLTPRLDHSRPTWDPRIYKKQSGNMIMAVGGQGIESNSKQILKHNKNALRNTLQGFAEN